MNRDWSSTTRIFVVVVALILAAVFLYAFQPMIKPLVVAGLLAYCLNLVVIPLAEKTRLSRKAAVNVVYFLLLILLIATPSTLIPILVSQTETITAELLLIQGSIQEFLMEPLLIFNREILLNEVVADLFTFTGESFVSDPESALNVIEVTSFNIIRILVVFVTAYYLMIDSQGLQTWLVNLATEGTRPDIRRLIAEIDHIWRAYIRGTLALMLIMAIVFIILGLAIGLPGAVAIGLVTGLLSMVPEVGPFASGILAVLVALFEGSNFLPIPNFWFAVIVASIYMVVMQIKSIWLRPKVMGRFMHMNTGLVFLAIIAAVLLEGVLGALIVLPILASVGVIGRYVRARMLNLDPWGPESAILPPHIPVEADAEPEQLSKTAVPLPGKASSD